MSADEEEMRVFGASSVGSKIVEGGATIRHHP
jgi:hypothetical protein